ncbi:MAG: HD domain-containing protein [Chloroflexota bacterium]
MTSPIDFLAGLFAGEGLQSYLGEELSIAAHMLQAGALAEGAGAPNELVAAALLHDVGHFGAIAGRQTGPQELEATDHRHQEIGADWLAKWFPQVVTEPVRLHVLAKRYLCSVESGYFETLSPASVHTLALQGGPLTPAETWAFERLPYARDAVAVRRWDEVAKDPAVAIPPFEHFRELLAQARTR